MLQASPLLLSLSLSRKVSPPRAAPLRTVPCGLSPRGPQGGPQLRVPPGGGGDPKEGVSWGRDSVATAVASSGGLFLLQLSTPYPSSEDKNYFTLGNILLWGSDI